MRMELRALLQLALLLLGYDMDIGPEM